jgi:hypothetical protein
MHHATLTTAPVHPVPQVVSGGHAFMASHLKHDFSQVRTYSTRGRSAKASITRSLFPTDEGTETFVLRSLETKSADGGPPGAGGGAPAPIVSSCPLTGGAFSNIPNGQTLVAGLSGSKLTKSFNMIGDFTAGPGCSCSCGEYRQNVRGTFTKNGAAVTHALCGSNLDPSTYQEDCARIGGTDYKYGYRSNPFGTSNFVNPDQATGCQFKGYDSPGIIGSSGDKLAMSLDFRGQLVDTCSGNKVLATADWSVGGAATVP